MQTALLGVLFILVAAWNKGGDYWSEKWWLALTLMAIFVGLQVRKKYSAWLAIPVIITLLNGLLFFATRGSPFHDYPEIDRLLIQNYAATATATFLFFVAFFLTTSAEMLKKHIPVALTALTIFNALYSLYGYKLGDEGRGLFLNLSMNAGFMAIMIFTVEGILHSYLHWVFRVFVVGLIAAACMVQGASMPLLTLAAGSFACGFWYVHKLVKDRTKFWLFSIFAVEIFFGVLYNYLKTPHKWMSTVSNGRVQLWMDTFNFAWFNENLLTGQGIGTSQVWLPHITDLDPAQAIWRSYFIWLHQDWGQILLEGGLPLFLAVVLMYGAALVRAFKLPHPATFASLIAYGFFMMGNFPMHLPLHAFLGAWLLAKTFYRGERA
jgi:hypothetical protein